MSGSNDGFTFTGRINRKTYWQGLGGLFGSYFICLMICAALAEGFPALEPLMSVILFLFSIGIVTGFFSISVRRLHDLGKSGWWLLPMMIPWVGWLGYFIVVGCYPGEDKVNKFGAPSHQNSPPETAHAASHSTGSGRDIRRYEHLTQKLTDDFVDLIALLAAIAKSDGNVSDEETNAVDGFFEHAVGMPDEFRIEALKIFHYMLTQEIDFAVTARRFYEATRSNPEQLVDTLKAFFILSVINGEMSAEAELLIGEAASIFHISSPDYEEYKTHRETHKKRDSEHYARVLGVAPDAPIEDIRRAYRRLATDYHPDKVASVSEGLRELAQVEMQKINEAYDYFKKNRK